MREAEERATSALLAVLSIVRPLSRELLSPLGASRAERASVDAYTEVIMKLDGRRIRPDGLIRVAYGKSVWSCLVEVKTGHSTLEADQINAYWDLARADGIDHILTISNELAPQPGIHPTDGLKVRANSKVGVSHLSWSAILTAALRIKQHAGVEDVEQAWILGELIRYLQHPKSGALEFGDMGPNWTAIRDGARVGDLTKRTEGVADVSDRWDQLLRFASLRLSSEIGEDVAPVLPRGQRDPKQRRQHLIDCLVRDGTLNGTLKIPNTAGNIEVTADLRARQICASMDISAPEDRGARARVTWLVKQLGEAPPDLMVDAFTKGARTPITTSLGQLQENRDALLDPSKQEPNRFRLFVRREMGLGRAHGGKRSGFITSILDLIDEFYGSVVQHVSPWQRPAPRLTRPAPAERPAESNNPEQDVPSSQNWSVARIIDSWGESTQDSNGPNSPSVI